MSTKSVERLALPAWFLATACLIAAIAVEIGLVQPLRLPGHRALPAVTALLCFGRLLPAPLAIGYAVLAPTVTSFLRPGSMGVASLYALWLGGAIAALALRPLAVNRTLLTGVAFGSLFGLGRALLFAHGAAHAGPSRMLGNVMFGAVGGLLAALIMRPAEEK